MIPAGSLGIGEGLADDILKVGVHGGMRARSEAKEKPRRLWGERRSFQVWFWLSGGLPEPPPPVNHFN